MLPGEEVEDEEPAKEAEEEQPVASEEGGGLVEHVSRRTMVSGVRYVDRSSKMRTEN